MKHSREGEQRKPASVRCEIAPPFLHSNWLLFFVLFCVTTCDVDISCHSACIKSRKTKHTSISPGPSSQTNKQTSKTNSKTTKTNPKKT